MFVQLMRQRLIVPC